MKQRSLGHRRHAWVAAMLAVVALPLLVSSGLAQEATPVGEAQMGDGPHPAHVHIGTCDTLGEVVAPLTDVATRTGEESRAGAGHPVKGSHTVVDMSLDDLLSGEHAINVHLSADEIDTYIACGDVAGVVFTDDDDDERQLIIGLGELNDSGHVGVAWISEEGDQTEIAVNLVEPDEMR